MRASALALFLLAVPVWGAAPKAAPPELISVAPIGGRPGASFEATLRGKNLEGVTRVWSPSEGLTAEVLGVESGKTDKDPDALKVRFHFTKALTVGAHDLRVITPQGLSNAVQMLAHEQPAVQESAEAHDLPRQAQKIEAWPAVVHGRIAEVGEVDFYSLQVKAGQELLFRTFSSAPLDPGVEIYELTGSWFDPDRPTRLAFADEPVEYPDEPVETVLRYRFDKAGEYLVRVNGFWGYGGADHVYALLIDPAPDGPVDWPPATPESLWTERTWRRPLDEDRMARLAGRTVAEAEPAKIQVLDADAEVTQLPVEPPKISGPTLVVGSIERAGDIDKVRFSVAEGDNLTFEIQTPEKSLPELNPLLRIVDDKGVEALTNVWSRVNANGNISKQIYPKTQYSFPRAGEFTLEIRDITAVYGGRGMDYKVLIRPFVPHLGEAHVGPDRVNLVAGKAQNLNVVIDQEEGYEGLATFSIEGLPPGVEALMGADVDPDSPPPFNEGKKERFTTKSQKATFVLMPAADAPLTPTPVAARIYARPAVGGKLGEKILAKQILMMVVADATESPETGVLTDGR
ncbi:MAG: hypothetical protein GC160_11290 [Acidobacteria bacterium]|nr:hypothetical protein [Acidobacteriota bacterium]